MASAPLFCITDPIQTISPRLPNDVSKPRFFRNVLPAQGVLCAQVFDPPPDAVGAVSGAHAAHPIVAGANHRLNAEPSRQPDLNGSTVHRKFLIMFRTLLLFSLLGSAMGALTGAFGFGADGFVLGGSAGFVAGVMLWVLLWVGYQRLAPNLLVVEEEFQSVRVHRKS